MALVITVFLVVFAAVMLVVALSTSYFKTKQKRQISSMLKKAEAGAVEHRTSSLVKESEQEGSFADLLSKFSFAGRLDRLIEQSGQKTTSSNLILISFGALVVGVLVGSRISLLPQTVGGPLVGLVAGSAPFLLMLRKRAKNFSEFEKQFPEALDFLSRSMRAGHGFSIAIEMLASDSPDPLGSAFRRVSNDLQLGSSLDSALNKLSNIVPLLDVRFFVSSVLLQQETGGNLSEILSKLGQIIRERFRLKGQVKAVSAHGRITGLVLVLMPVCVALIMMVTSPQYLIDLANDKIGRIMIYGSIVGQIVGYFVIRKIINIKV